jgi:hypothetical protein
MQAPRSFFDTALLEKFGAAFISEDKVDEALRRLIPKAHITKGGFSCPGWAEQRDLLWNHMDQTHRPHVHRTYGEAMRVHIGERAAVTLTRFGGWPVIIPVFDGHYKDNGFYQVMCLFGLIVVVNVIEANVTPQGTRMDIRWAIASHRLLRFVHPYLDRRLHRLNVVQNAEDDVIRHRRVELRAAGYRFATDAPDFVSANSVANNVIYPPVAERSTVALADIPTQQVHRVEVGKRAYLLRRTEEGVEVWPGVCPHEGAVLSASDVGGRAARCPWHGLEFAPRRLRLGAGSITLCGARLSLSERGLDILPTDKDAA